MSDGNGGGEKKVTVGFEQKKLAERVLRDRAEGLFRTIEEQETNAVSAIRQKVTEEKRLDEWDPKINAEAEAVTVLVEARDAKAREEDKHEKELHSRNEQAEELRHLQAGQMIASKRAADIEKIKTTLNRLKTRKEEVKAVVDAEVAKRTDQIKQQAATARQQVRSRTSDAIAALWLNDLPVEVKALAMSLPTPDMLREKGIKMLALPAPAKKEAQSVEA